MKKSTRILAIALTLILLVGIMPLHVFAAPEDDSRPPSAEPVLPEDDSEPPSAEPVLPEDDSEPPSAEPVLSEREANLTFDYPVQMMAASQLGDGALVDLVFVIDDSGSMSGSINNVKNNITQFVKDIQGSDINIRIGIVMYRDNSVNASRVITVNGMVWHKTYDDVIASLGNAVISGGIEPTLDALGFVTSPTTGAYDWRAGAVKHCVLLTDEWMETTWNRHGYSSLNDVIEDAIKMDLSISVVTTPNLMDDVASLVDRTGGSVANINDSSFQGFFLDFSGNMKELETPETRALTILDSDGNPLADKGIFINGSGVTTQSDGSVPFPEAVGDIIVEADGYQTYIFDTANVSGKSKTIKLESIGKTGKKPYISSAHIHNNSDSSIAWRDLALNETHITQDSTDGFDINVYVVWQGHDEGKLYLMQDDSRKILNLSNAIKTTEYTTSDGKTAKYSKVTFANQRLGTKFIKGKDIYLSALCGDHDNTQSPAYRAKLAITEYEAPSFDTEVSVNLFEDISVVVPSSVPLIGNAQVGIEIGAYKAYIEQDGNLYKVALGVEIDKKFNGKDQLFDADDWIGYKNEIKEFKKKSHKLANLFGGDGRIARGPAKRAAKKMDLWKIAKIDAELVGYVELMNVNGNLIVTDSGGFLEITGTAEKQFYLPCAFPVYVDVELIVSLSAEANDFISNPGKKPLPFDLSIKFESDFPKIVLGLAAGIKDVASAGIYGSGALNLKYELPNKDFTLALKASASLKIEALFFTILDWQFWDTPNGLVLYPQTRAADPSLFGEDVGTEPDFYDTSNAELMPRDYKSRWLGGEAQLMGITDGSSFDVLQSDIFPISRHSLVSFGNGQKMLVWLTDDTGRSASNRTLLVYSIYNPADGQWSTPRPIHDDGTADFYPTVATDGTNVYVAWQNSSEIFSGDDVTMKEVASKGEIYLAVFSGGSFGAAQRITDNTTLDTTPVLAVEGTQVKVVWINNSADDIFGFDGVNSVMVSSLTGGSASAPKTLTTSASSIHAMDAAISNGTLYAAYASDMDDDYTDTSDIEVFRITENGGTASVTRLTDNDVMDTAPQFGKIDGEMRLFWYSENNLSVLKSIDGTASESVFSAPNGVNDSYTVARSDTSTNYVVWPQMENDHVVFYSSVFDGSQWNAPVAIGSKETKAINPSAIVDGDGSVWVAFNEVEQVKVVSGEGFSYLADDKTNLCLLRTAPDAILTVNDDLLYVDYRSVVPGGYIPLNLTVKNEGFVAIDEVDVYIGGELYTTISMKLLPGQQEALTIAYTLPEVIQREALDIKVLPRSLGESRGIYTAADATDENTVTVSYGYTELGITEAKVEDAGMQKLLSFTVENESYVESGAFVVKIHEDSIDGNVIGEYPVASLAAVDYAQFNHFIDKNSIVYGDSGVKSYVLEIVSTQEEYFDGNNTFTVSFAQEISEGVRAEILAFTVQGSTANVYGAVYNNELTGQSYNVNIELLNAAGEIIGTASCPVTVGGKSFETIDEIITAANSEVINAVRFQLDSTVTLAGRTSQELIPDTPANADVTDNSTGLVEVFKFTVPDGEGGLYEFTSAGTGADTYASLYEEDGTLLVCDDNGNDGKNFNLVYKLDAGSTYYYKVATFSNSTHTGFNVKVQGPGSTAVTLKKVNDGAERTVSYVYVDSDGTETELHSVTVMQGSNINLTHLAEKPGWIFMGWNTNAAVGSALTSIKAGGSDLTLYAVFKNQTSVAFVDYSGTEKVTRNTTLSFNSDGVAVIILPPQNVLTGWTAIGWTPDTTVEGNKSYLSGTSYSVTTETAFYGLYQMPITLSYNANNGSNAPTAETIYHKINSYSDAEDSEAIFIVGDAPTRANYAFMGWSKTSNAQEAEYQPGDEIALSASTTLYAIWSARSGYTVSYNANGGTGAPSNQTKFHGQTLNITNGVPSRIGYVFLGWSSDPASKNIEYLPGSGYNEDGDRILYAVWGDADTILLDETKSVPIEFGGQQRYYRFTPAVSGKYAFVTSGHPATVYSHIYAGGTQLSSTYSSSSFSLYYDLVAGETYYYCSRFSSGSQTGSYAINLIRAYTVTYDANGGSGAPSSQTKNHGTNINLQTGQPSRSGFTFLGWSESSTDTAATYGRGDVFTKDADTTLYAIWTDGVIYTIKYHTNSGSGSFYDSIKAEGVDLRLTSIRPTRTNYIFLGWSEDSKSETASYQPGGTFSENKSTTLYAIWQILENYNVTYDANDGTSAPNAQTKYQGINLTLSGDLPNRVGYIFRGWSLDAQSTEIAYLPGSSYTGDAPLALYAVWNPAKDLSLNTVYDVAISFGREYELYKFIPNVSSDYTVTTSGQTSSVYTYILSETGSNLRSGSSSSSFGVTHALEAGVTYYIRTNYNSNTVTGSYQVRLDASYNITYDGNGVSVTNVPSGQAKAHGMPLTLQQGIPARFGYNFIGWSTDPAAKTAEYQAGGNYTADAAAKLYAVWAIPNALTLNTTLAVNIKGQGEQQYVRFTPVVSGAYLLTSGDSAAVNKHAYLFDALGNQLAYDTSYGAGSGNFAVFYMLNAGETYYYRVRYASTSNTGSFSVVIANSYRVTYDANGDNVKNLPNAQNKQKEIALVLSTTVPTRYGYTFLGWSRNPGAVRADYLPGESYYGDAQLALYAVWLESPEMVLNTAYDSSITMSNQVRYYKFSPSVTARYHFYSLENGTTNPYGELYNASGSRITYNDNAVSGNSNFGIYYDLTEGQTYYLLTRMYNTSEKGTFKVQVSQTCVVTYDANGGTGTPASQYKDFDIPYMLQKTGPTKFGYTLVGWSADSTATDAELLPGDYYDGNGDITFFAVWQEAAEILADTNVPVNTKYNKQNFYLFTPNETGTYRFATTGAGAGTYVYVFNTTSSSYLNRGYSSTGDSSLTRELTKGTSYYLMTELYDTGAQSEYTVKVIRSNYMITYDANGGSGGPSSQSKETGIDLILTTSRPTRSGYSFMGWSTNPNATVPEYVSGDRYTKDEEAALYAVWTSKPTYTVSFNANGGTNAPPAQIKAEGVDLTITSTKPTRENYRFAGWAETSSAVEAEYQSGGSFVKDANTTLYAVWQALETHTVVLDHNNGTLGQSLQTKYSGVALTIPVELPVYTGRRFIGWAKTPTAKTPDYMPGDLYEPDEDITLYALWSAAPPVISLNTVYSLNIQNSGDTVYYRFTPGAVGTYSLTSSDNTQDPIAELYSADGTRLAFDDDSGTGNNFKLSAALSPGVEYIYKVKFYADDVTGTLRIRLTADTTSYYVSYNANGGIGSPELQIKYKGETLKLSTEIPTRTNYVFVGWGTSPDDTTAKYQAGDDYTEDESAELYAIWSAELQSDHPYENYTDKTWSYTHNTAAHGLAVTFSADTFVESGKDFIYIYNKDGSNIPGSPFTGEELGGKTVQIKGDSFKIRLVSDESGTGYGFTVTGITASDYYSPGPLTNTSYQVVDSEEGLEFTVSAAKFTRPLDSGVILLAVYDNNGKLLCNKRTQCDASASYTIATPFYSGVTVKVFVWNSLDLMEPLGEAEVFTIPM